MKLNNSQTGCLNADLFCLMWRVLFNDDKFQIHTRQNNKMNPHIVTGIQQLSRLSHICFSFPSCVFRSPCLGWSILKQTLDVTSLHPYTCHLCTHLIKNTFLGAPGWFSWLSIWLLILAQVMIPGSWDRAQRQALRWVWNLLSLLLLPLSSLSLFLK